MTAYRFSPFLVLLAVAASPAWAAEIDGAHPSFGAPGDLVYVQGRRIPSQPTVTIGGVRAEVVRRRTDVLVCRVPPGLAEGAVELSVDGSPAPATFGALPPGVPVVYGLSAETGTCGQALFAHGRRLHHGRVSFVDVQGRTAATIGVVGGRRAVAFLVPETLDPGSYELLITNGDGLSTGAVSPRFEVVRSGEPRLDGVHPACGVPYRPATPGQRIRCVGTDLGPRGPCRLQWTDRHGVRTQGWGRSNGYDTVWTTVPGTLQAGEPHDVRIELGSGAVTASVTWTAAARAAPDSVTLDPAEGPAGDTVAVRGAGLLGGVAEVQAELSSPAGTVTADVVFRHPGGLGSGAAWILRIPEELAEGDYDLHFRIGGRALPAMPYRVGEQPLTVTGLWPTRPLGDDTDLSTMVHGSGFGSATAADDLRVVWTNGNHTREGTVVFRSDRLIRALPFSAYPSPPSQESWSVYVLRGRGTATRAVKAGAVTFGSW